VENVIILKVNVFFNIIFYFESEEGFFIDESPVSRGLSCEKAEGGNSFDFDIVWEFWVLIAAAVVWSEESNIVSFEGFYEVVGVESCSSEGIGWKLKCEEEDVEFAHGFSSVQ